MANSRHQSSQPGELSRRMRVKSLRATTMVATEMNTIETGRTYILHFDSAVGARDGASARLRLQL